MSTNFYGEAIEALNQHLADFTYAAAPVEIRWITGTDAYQFGISYIEVASDLSQQDVQDQAVEIRSRVAGMHVLTLKVPEPHGQDGLALLADALSEHFMPNGEVIAYSVDSADDKQAAHILRKPRLRGLFAPEGGFVKGELVIDFFLQPQRDI